MLMNLTRMRQFNWSSHIEPISRKLDGRVKLFDQNVIDAIINDNNTGKY